MALALSAGAAAVPAVHNALHALERADALPRDHADALLDRRQQQRGPHQRLRSGALPDVHAALCVMSAGVLLDSNCLLPSKLDCVRLESHRTAWQSTFSFISHAYLTHYSAPCQWVLQETAAALMAPLATL
jgi:hypothetical protein